MPTGPPAEIDSNAIQVAMVQRIKPALVHVKIAQSAIRRARIDAHVTRDGGKISNPTQQPSGYARRAP